MHHEAQAGNFLRFWEVNSNTNNEAASIITVKALNGYVPVFTVYDLYNEQLLSLLFAATKAINCRRASGSDPRGSAKDVSSSCQTCSREQNGKYAGIEALGVLKQMSTVWAKSSAKASAKASPYPHRQPLSRQMNNFFAVYLPSLLQRAYPDTYTLFAAAMISSYRPMAAVFDWPGDCAKISAGMSA
jgi:hypothetical protein